MTNDVLLYVGGLIPMIWGIAHLPPTMKIVELFRPISKDNERILVMEWMAEGVALIFCGLLVLVMTFTGNQDTEGGRITFFIASGLLLTFAISSLLTGARTPYVPMKLCVPIFTLSAVLVLSGAML